VSLRVTGLSSLGRRKYLSLALRTDRPCRATISARRFRTTTIALIPGRREVVRLRLAHLRPLPKTVAIRVAAPNARTLVKRVRPQR
jgi:hypothetical protein